MKGYFDFVKCCYVLGMQDWIILDSDIFVFSFWLDFIVVCYSRLESSDGDGVWCFVGFVFFKEEEYLQVDL